MLLAGLIALLAAIAVTPVGQEWATRHRRLPPEGLHMISLRHHVASLVAVFLALAVGIALGGGPLADTDDEPTASRPHGARAARAAATTAPPTYADAFAAASAARLYADGLAGHAVAVLAMPGAEAAQIKALTAQVVAAGGAITGTFTAGDGAARPRPEDAWSTPSAAS